MPLSDQTRAMLGLGGNAATPSAPVVRPKPAGLSPQTRQMLGLGSKPSAPVEPEPAEEPSWVEKYAPTIVRIGLPVLGGIAGSVVPGVGTAAGAALGGALGAGVGEVAAEKLEGRELDPVEIGLSTALGAVPAGPAGRMAGKLAAEAAKTGQRQLLKRAGLHAAEGAAQGLLAEGAHSVVKEGRLPTLEEAGRGVAFGTVLGGALGAGADLAGIGASKLRGRAPEVDAPPVVDAPAVEAPRVVETAPPESGLRRPSFLDEGLDPDLPPGPELGYGRGGVPIEPRPPVDIPPTEAPPIAQQPLEEPGVTFTEQTPLPREGDRRVAVEPTATERRLAQRRSEFATRFGLPEEHPAVVEAMAMHTEARTDALTSLPNKRAWSEDILPSLTPNDHVVVLDMSKLKPINDKLGHGAGDTAIKTFAGVVREVFGGEAARIGGDEVAAILRGMNRQQADQLTEAFRQAAANRPTKLRNAQTGETVDIPGFEAHIGVGKSFDEADAAANAAAALSRKGGRGDVPIVQPNPAGTPPDAPTPATTGAGLGDSPGVAGPRFNRAAALERIKTAGVTPSDLAEIGASYIEEYAARNKGRIVAFESWARATYQALKDVAPNIRKQLRQIYDQAVEMFNRAGITFGSLPNEPRGVIIGSLGGALQPPGPKPPAMPPPKMLKEAKAPTVIRPIPPTVEAPVAPPSVPPPDQPPVRTQVTGRPMEPGEAPRVESRVDDLRVAEKEADQIPAELDRDTKQRWKDLDKPVQKILREYDDDRFYNVMKSRNLDAAETMAWDARVKGKAERLEELRTKIRGNPADDVAKRDLVAADLDFIAAQRASVNDGTGLARALAARARIMEGARQPNDLFLKKVFRELPNVSDKQASEMMQAFRENPENLQPMLHAAVGHGTLQKALELWKANMLSAFSTDIANFSGNAIEHHMQLAQTATSSFIDAALQKIYGGNRARFAGEFGAEWAGGNQAFAPALKNLGRNLMETVVKGKRKPIDLSRRLEYQTSALDPKGLGQYTSRVFGKLEVADQFFKEWGGGAELSKLAYRKAAKGGGSPEQIQKRAAEIMQQISDPANAEHADILRAVAASKDARTFQEQRADSLTESVAQFVRRHPMMQLVVPFVRTPGNIAARIIERSPLGAKKAMQAFNAFRDARGKFEAGEISAEDFAEVRGRLADAISGPLMGTAMLAGFAGLASAGAMTGGGPTDPKDKNALRDSGWSPYSFVLTNPATGKKTYIPFNRFEPVSSLMGFAADMIEAKDAKTSGDLFDKALGSLVSNLSSKSYLQGLSESAALLSNPKQFASEYVRGQAGSLVPNIIGRAASAVDPTFRDTRPSTDGPLGILEAAGKTVVSRIPVASTLLPERRSGTGEPIERQGDPVSRFLAPAPPSAEKEGGDFNRFLVDIDAVPSAPGRDLALKGKRVRLSEEEYKAIQDADAKVTAELRKRLPALKRADPEKARNVIRSAYDQARSSARKKVLATPEFKRRFSEVQS